MSGLTFIYVIVSIGQLLAIHRQADIAEVQSRNAKKSAETAEKAATAARDSADALMNAERPWITLSVVRENADCFSFHL